MQDETHTELLSGETAVNRTLKERLDEMFLEHPLLRVMLWDRRFRWFAGAFVMVLVGVSLMLPKIWRSTPPQIEHAVKMSGVDYLQAAALKRSALAEQERGDWAKALISWEMARANHPGDPELTRGVIGTRLRGTNVVDETRVVFDGNWLLALTHTNSGDLALVARLYEHHRMDAEVVRLLSSGVGASSPELQGYYLRSLFNLGEVGTFSSRLEKLGPTELARAGLVLHGLAYRAGWGEATLAMAARTELETSASRPGPDQELANRLLLAVGIRKEAPSQALVALDRLTQLGVDTLRDHLRYWRLLVALDNRRGAIERMEIYKAKPKDQRDTAAWVELWLACNQESQAEALLRWAMDNQTMDPPLRILHANLLIRKKRWEELSLLGHAIRQRGGSSLPLMSFGYYLEVRGSVGAGREFDAKRSVEAIAALDADTGDFAVVIGQGLSDAGYASVAVGVLKKSGVRWDRSAEYWSALCVAANRILDEKTLVVAAKRFYELEPQNPMAVNNYACALLIMRERAGEAVALTSGLVRERPGNLTLMLNYASALLLSGRANEAKEIVLGIRPDRLTRSEMAQYEFTRCELGIQLRDKRLAAEAHSRIDPATLFPEQARWLSLEMEKLRKGG